MGKAAVATVKLSYIDRDINDAQLTLYVGADISVNDVFLFALDKIDHIARISDAIATRIEIVWKWGVDLPVAPGVNSNTRRGLLLFAQNTDDEFNAIRIPSPRHNVFETVGTYANIRVDMQNTAMIDFNSMLLSEPLRTADNREFGIIVTGGLAT